MATLSGFAAALTATDLQPPPGLAGPAGRRFAVYRNNVAVGLIGALEARFPAVRALVGEEFFRAMARDFTLSHPPASPVLMVYGDALPDFIAAFPPAADLPYLADVARIEAARTRAYHAADAPRLGPAAFAGIDPTAVAGLRLDLNPAVELVAAAHPACTIFRMALGLEPAGPIDPWLPQHTLVDRPAHDVTVRLLPPGAHAFLAALGAGAPLGAAAAGAADPRFDPAAALAELIGSGLACRIHLPETHDDDA
ncbi:DNA-binding domain-containing protein [Azorhizobium doebereinerae]|uniref:HvfC/BufC N-terminal domain-containing protein n=1 Tax=Azorhizobium doebereinerae TaxID=281091 RepID=UPI0004262ECC|nr:DNA-binding domain-containing protein [Azorhizobium doebereinerae]